MGPGSAPPSFGTSIPLHKPSKNLSTYLPTYKKKKKLEGKEKKARESGSEELDIPGDQCRVGRSESGIASKVPTLHFTQIPFQIPGPDCSASPEANRIEKVL